MNRETVKVNGGFGIAAIVMSAALGLWAIEPGQPDPRVRSSERGIAAQASLRADT